MRRALMFLPVLVAVSFGLFLYAGLGKDPTELDSALIGKPVPAFELEKAAQQAAQKQELLESMMKQIEEPPA